MKDASDSQPQEQLYVAAQRPHRRPPTQDPRCWRPLNITASCGRTVWAACHAHCLWSGCQDPGPPPDPQCAHQAGLASFTPHPHSAPLFSLSGSQPTHPTCSPPPSQGAAPVSPAPPKFRCHFAFPRLLSVMYKLALPQHYCYAAKDFDT